MGRARRREDRDDNGYGNHRRGGERELKREGGREFIGVSGRILEGIKCMSVIIYNFTISHCIQRQDL